ncbi:DUF1376 domain-containing protein, partial [Caulobacter sp. 17J65-9]|uniref:YdaU family protein n=1 Tax=Caulobacter sp. 17J65-9 TaxID=2709382 RepID=UPI0013CD46CC
MNAPPYMPLYVADYLGDTRHLTTVQHGAYVLLMMAMWRGGGRLPAEPARLARLAGLTPARWARIAAEVTAFFTLEDGALTHPRLAAELDRYARTVDARRVAGAKGAAARNRPANAGANAGAEPAQTGGRSRTPAAAKTAARPRQPEPEPKPEPEPEEGRIGAVDARGWGRAELDRLERALRDAAGPALDAASPVLLNLAPILGLLTPGRGPPADLEADVLPAVRAVAARSRPGSVRGWGYFAETILTQRDRRLAGAPATDPTESSDERSRP